MFAIMNERKLLHTSQLFRELSDAELDQVWSVVAVQRLGKGQILFLEGDVASGFYILLSGRMRVYKANPEGREQTLHQINPGQAFGEAAAFSGRLFPANSAALENSVVAYIPAESFRKILSSSPNISLKMIASLSNFLREFNQIVENLSLKEVSARLASYLMRQHQKSGNTTIELGSSKTELARRLGTVSETLSRNLRKMIDLGAINVDGRKIAILNIDLLAEISEGKKI